MLRSNLYRKKTLNYNVKLIRLTSLIAKNTRKYVEICFIFNCKYDIPVFSYVF